MIFAAFAFYRLIESCKVDTMPPIRPGSFQANRLSQMLRTIAE
jgi:hypothetical protein